MRHWVIWMHEGWCKTFVSSASYRCPGVTCTLLLPSHETFRITNQGATEHNLRATLNIFSIFVCLETLKVCGNIKSCRIRKLWQVFVSNFNGLTSRRFIFSYIQPKAASVTCCFDFAVGSFKSTFEYFAIIAYSTRLSDEKRPDQHSK